MSRVLIQAALVAVIIFYAYSETLSKDNIRNRKPDPNLKTESRNKFKKFLHKFEPLVVSENLAALQKNQGYNYSRRDYINLAFQKLDVTADLMKLKVRNGDPKIIYPPSKDGRRWRPPLGIAHEYNRDKFSLRRRLFELMKQAVYQARNKMVIMQILREKYRNDPVYKMGFLMGKTDNACKTFSKVAFRSFRICTMFRIQRIQRFSLYESLVLEEHLLHLLTTVEMLVDLVIQNHLELLETLKFKQTERKKHWKFTD